MEEDAEQIAEDHTAKGGGYQKRKTQTDECGDGKIHLRSKNEHEKTEKEIDDNQDPPDLLEVFHQGAGPFRHELPLSASQVSFVIRAQEPAIRNSKAERRNPPSRLHRFANGPAEWFSKNTDLGDDPGDEAVGGYIEGRIKG